MTKQFSFNLVDEAWMPCVRVGGATKTPTKTLSLRQILTQAHQLQTMTGDSPPQTAALHRFLLAILHRIFGPADEDEWAALWQAEAFEANKINAYLDKWRHRFDLFDTEHPFYQAADNRVRTKSVISLNHDRASGNNSTLFDHHTEAVGETLTPAQAARTLITAQSYGLAGLAGIKGKTFTDGTCAGGVIFLVEGDMLKETLLLNMIQYPPDDSSIFLHTDEDCPAWEMDNPLEPERDTPLGYLDYLTWPNRRVLFQPEQGRNGPVVRSMTMGPALRFDQTVIRDTMKHYRIDDKIGAIAFSFSENRVLWRDSATFFTFQSGDPAKKVRPPATFYWLRGLTEPVEYLKKEKLYRCMALGMSKKQAKVFFFREERLPLHLAYLTDQSLVNRLSDALDKTATIAFDLQQAARRMGMFLQIPNADSKKWGELNRNQKSAINDWVTHTGVERRYWASLETPFQKFILDLVKDKDSALDFWRNHLRKAANAAFEQVEQYVGNDSRSFKATVRGKAYLNSRLNKVLPKENVANESE